MLAMFEFGIFCFVLFFKLDGMLFDPGVYSLHIVFLPPRPLLGGSAQQSGRHKSCSLPCLLQALALLEKYISPKVRCCTENIVHAD